MSSPKFFPDPRRIVTGHTSTGDATVLRDSTVPCERSATGSHFAVLWETDQFPASCADEGSDGTLDDPINRTTKSLANENGVVLRVVDFPPGQKGIFHRTVSLDFGILFEGEMICVFDNDEKVHMKPGDVCVQRGTIHGWQNPGDKPARMYFVLIAAEPLKFGEKVLGNEGFEDKDVASGGKKEEKREKRRDPLAERYENYHGGGFR